MTAVQPAPIPVQPRLHIVAALLAVVGLADSIYLTVTHLTGEDVTCVASSGCSEVLSSPYASVGPIPLGAFGVLGYFLAFQPGRPGGFGYRAGPDVSAHPGCGDVGHYALASLCAGFHPSRFLRLLPLSAALTLSLSPSSWLASSPQEGTKSQVNQRPDSNCSDPAMRRFLPFLIIGVVLLIAAGGGLLLFRSKSSSTPIKIARQAGSRAGTRSRCRECARDFGRVRRFQCPPCGVLAATLLKVEHDYGKRLRVVFRQFPLPMHAHAMTAACAAEAAGLQGHFWEMHDLLFQNAETWGKEGPRPLRRVMPSTEPKPRQMRRQRVRERSFPATPQSWDWI